MVIRANAVIKFSELLQYFTSRQIYGRFMSGKANEEVLCMPAREYLPKSVDVCNLTLANGGMSWYCVKPKYKQLLCEDWTDVRNIKGGQNYINTAAESLLFGYVLLGFYITNTCTCSIHPILAHLSQRLTR